MAEISDWMARTWGGKAAMMANVLAKLAGHQSALGLTNAQRDAALDLCAEFLAVYNFYTQAKAWADGLTEWRDLAMTGNPVGSALPDPTAAPAWVAPQNAIVGMLKAFREMRDQWVAAPGYTKAIGEDLMIVKADSESLNPNFVTPIISVSAAQSGFLVGVTVSDRGEADQWIVEIKQGGGNWQNAGSFTGKTADIVITPTTPGQPEVVQIRVRLRRKNADYGNFSQIASVTVNP